MSFENRIKQNQFVRNIFSNGFLFFINSIIGLWITPYLIRYLGIEVYGMIPLANQITSYLSLFTLAITGAVGRFLSIDIVRNNYIDANKTFNTTFFSSLILSLSALPFVGIFLLFIPNLIKIPAGHEIETQFLFIIIFFTFILTFLQTGFLVSSWVKKRFDIRNIAILIGKIIQVALLIILFNKFHPNVWIYGISLLLSNIVIFIGHYYIWRILTPELMISKKYFDITYLKKLVNIGKWIIVDQIGTVLLLNIDLILVNQLLGPKIGGEYGSLVIIPSTIRIFISTISGVLSPFQMEKFALNDFYGLEKVSTTSIRALGIILALIVGLVCSFSKDILELWLGIEFGYLWKLLVILVIPLLFTLPMQILYQLQVAYKKVSVPALVTLFLGLLNIPLSLIFVKYFNYGAIGIAFSCGITYTLRTTLFSSIYGTIIQRLKIFSFIKEILPGIIFSFLVVIVSLLLKYIFVIDTLYTLILIIGLTTIICSVVCYIFLPKNDKLLILQFLPHHENEV